MIDKIKLLVDEDIDDLVLEIYVDRATVSIRNYLNSKHLTEEDIAIKFQPAIILMVENAVAAKARNGVKSYTQGKRSESYQDDVNFVISDQVSKLLPYPYLRVM